MLYSKIPQQCWFLIYIQNTSMLQNCILPGSVPDISKRLLGIHYRTVRAESSPLLVSVFKYLGIVMLAQITYELYNICVSLNVESGSGTNSMVSSTLTFVDENYVIVEERDQSVELENLDLSDGRVELEQDSENENVDARSSTNERSSKASQRHSSVKCPLCLSSGNWLAATECGHVFCYECILDYLNEKDDCPICRCLVRPHRVVPLLNV